jgi:hypothetical protein
VTLNCIGPESSSSPSRFAALLPHSRSTVDVIYGRNLTGEQANWITVGLNVRFDAMVRK